MSAGHDNDVGYLKKTNEKGGDGYQHFESYHDKDGDSYGYEKHEAFGKSNDGGSSKGNFYTRILFLLYTYSLNVCV